MSKKYVESVNKKTIQWSRKLCSGAEFFNANKRGPNLVDLLKDTMEQNLSNGFEGEDPEVKQEIDKLCKSLIVKYEADDTKNLLFFTELIGLGEYLFSSNHQHFDIAQKIMLPQFLHFLVLQAWFDNCA